MHGDWNDPAWASRYGWWADRIGVVCLIVLAIVLVLPR